ncbi:fumarylacetoacetate hydrolase family protein [bacterium]|nr:fumarylacetoacetate hydrolase family protein [bacterium]
MFTIVKNTSEKIFVSKILCVGANYPDHIAEMNPGKPLELPAEPVIFMKPPSAIIHDGDSIIIPKISNDVHHEVELIAVIGRDGKHIPENEAADYILGYGVGLDMTLRDIQSEAKKKGRPWTIAKGFDTSAAVSAIIPRDQFGDPHSKELRLFVNDVLKQTGKTETMIFKIGKIIADMSQVFTLKRGDIIYTGTPHGVGPVKKGDRLRATIGRDVELNVTVAAE